MIVDLTDTTASAIAGALTRARHSTGSPASGMVLTLVVVIDESGHYDAVRAATESAREHPSRIITVIPRPGRGGRARLDAEVRVGGENGPGEVVLMRLYGELGDQAASVVTPLLLPDAPVVTWWPVSPPASLARDPLGALSQRRISDSATGADPLAALASRSDDDAPGDTDLSWTRATPWRTNLAAALDQPYDPIREAVVEAERDNPTAALVAVWLEQRLRVPVRRVATAGPGITEVSLRMDRGAIVLTRPDGRLATLSRPGQPNRTVALPRRELPDLLAEELRRLDPDEVFAETAAGIRALAPAVDEGADEAPDPTPADQADAEPMAAETAALGDDDEAAPRTDDGPLPELQEPDTTGSDGITA